MKQEVAGDGQEGGVEGQEEEEEAAGGGDPPGGRGGAGSGGPRGAAAGGGIGGGGRGGGRPRGAAEGGGGDPGGSDDSDSDPEPDLGRHPRRWRAWANRRARERAMRQANEFVQSMLAQRRPEEPQDKDCKVSDPDPFKGDPEDLERFLLQITNKFIMEPRLFSDDVRKIRFAGQLMKDRAYKWYRAYHLQISSRDATRIRGDIELDPQYASWDRFEASLRATFGERITRKEAVREWERLCHTTSIDDFVDEITRLMWVTGFEGQQVEDKTERGLNDVIHLEWAKLPNKPYGIAEQLALL